MSTHLTWPPRLADGSLAETKQDTIREIEESLALACELRPGTLPWDPAAGIPNPLGTDDPDRTADEIRGALQAQEPRITGQLRVTPADRDGRPLRIHIEVTDG